MGGRDLIPLALLRPGEFGTLAEIHGLRHHDHGGEGAFHREPKGYRRGHLKHSDRGHRLEHRLNHMGLVPGEVLRVVQNSAPGPVIVAVKDSRLCLGRGVAFKLMVRPGGAPPAVETG